MKKQTKIEALKELADLRKKYPYIPAYSKIMGSYDYWTEQQLYTANSLNAPEDCYNVDISKNTYSVIGDIKNQSLVTELKMYAGK